MGQLDSAKEKLPAIVRGAFLCVALLFRRCGYFFFDFLAVFLAAFFFAAFLGWLICA